MGPLDPLRLCNVVYTAFQTSDGSGYATVGFYMSSYIRIHYSFICFRHIIGGFNAVEVLDLRTSCRSFLFFTSHQRLLTIAKSSTINQTCRVRKTFRRKSSSRMRSWMLFWCRLRKKKMSDVFHWMQRTRVARKEVFPMG
jgi:hypothetical protein